jgi:alpha-mannosidase
MRIEKIYLTPHFHFDFEWWKEEPYHEQDTLIILDEALRMLDKYPEFTYVIDSVLPLKKYMENRPDGKEKIQQFIETGRVEIVGGDIVAPDEVLPTGEALIRQFEEGQTWLKDVFGRTAQVAWEIDEFAHPARMPQVLAPLGFKYFVFARGVNPFDDMHPTLFKWHDPAGENSLTSYWWAAHYEGSLIPHAKAEKSKKELIKRWFVEMESRIAFEGERSPVPWLMVPLGGDFVIPNDSWIDFVNEWNRKKDIKIEFTLPSNYFEMVSNCEMPQITGLFPHVFDGYFTSREKSKQAGRQTANGLCDLEKLGALCGIRGLDSQTNALKEAWWETLKGDFHDTIAGTGTDRVYRKTMARYAHAEKIQESLEAEAINYMESLLSGKGQFIFNSLNWERKEVIEINDSEQLIELAPLAIENVNAKSPLKSGVTVSQNSIENQYLRITFDKITGELSVYDKEKDCFPITSGCNRTNIIDDAGNLWVTRSTGKRYHTRIKEQYTEQRSSVRAMIHSTEENGFVVIHKQVSLHAGSKRVQFTTDIDFKGKDKRIDMQFPFSFDGKWITENIFHCETVKNGIYPVQNFAMLKGDTYNVAILNKGIPGYLLEQQHCSIMLMRSVSVFSWSLLRWIMKNTFSILRHFRKAIVFMRNKLNIVEFPIYPIHNLFLRTFASEGNTLGHGAMNPRNHRKAMFRFFRESLAWERGKHSFTYALAFDVADVAEATRTGFELNHPVRQYHINGTGKHGLLRLLCKECPEVIISSVRPSNEGLLLRVYNPLGQKTEVELPFAIPIEKAFISCRSLDEMSEISCTDNAIRYVFDPFEMVQIHVKVNKLNN